MARCLGEINICQSYKFLYSDVPVDSSDFVITLSRNVKYVYMYAILRGTSALLALEVTFALCCAVHAVSNDRDEKRNGGNDDGGNNSHKHYYTSFQAHINK